MVDLRLRPLLLIQIDTYRYAAEKQSLIKNGTIILDIESQVGQTYHSRRVAMICRFENEVSASKTIGYIQIRLSGVHIATERAKYKASADTDQIIAHMRNRLRPGALQQFRPEKVFPDDDFTKC